MSTCTEHTMTNHHVQGILAGLTETFHVWRERHRSRQELTHWSDRDLQDVGLSWDDVATEAEKPFWRA